MQNAEDQAEADAQAQARASADAAAAGIDEADAEDMSLEAGEGSARSAAEVFIRPPVSQQRSPHQSVL